MSTPEPKLPANGFFGLEVHWSTLTGKYAVLYFAPRLLGDGRRNGVHEYSLGEFESFTDAWAAGDAWVKEHYEHPHTWNQSPSRG